MTATIFAPLPLPNGTTMPNRLVKAAMEEHLAAPGQLPGEAIIRLYDAWAKGGVGLIITGNVMVDPRALTGPGAVVLQEATDLTPFKHWAAAAKAGGGQIWMQISHPGRQVWAAHGQPGWAPSEVAVDLGKHSKLMARPKALTGAEISAIIQRFANTAQQAEKAGFSGVQIHGAHGYLVSQFLSPLSNQRSDEWGGSLENRARLLLEIIRSIRKVVTPGFGVGVKLNSADFQRGGFDAADAEQVVRMMSGLGVDLVELSGGNYEAPAMQGQTRDGRTLAREAFFLEFAARIAKVATMPIMTTGGIRRIAIAEQVLAEGVAVVGMGTALAMCPDLPRRWQNGQDVEHLQPVVTIKDKMLAALATMSMIRRQLQRIGNGKTPLAHPNVFFTIVRDRLRTQRLTKRYLRWLTTQGV